jgi:hypothetical protein
VVAVAVLGGCGESIEKPCTADRRLGLGIVVLNDRTGTHLCSAAVVARSGSYSETLTRTSDARVSPCLYVGAEERAGTYSIQAEAPGFVSKTLPLVTVTLAMDSCHVEQVIATVRLEPFGVD